MADRTLRVKIGIDTSGLKADAAEAARSFDGIGKAATKSADEAEKSTRKVGDETAKSADKSGAAWAKVGPWMGAAVAGGAVLAGKAILDLGMTYEQNLNQLQAVTRSTNDQMKSIGDTAMALGNDIDLPAASASDAAQAMLELAKGGLSAEQAMSAAKGTLTLAAAAQISGAEAATIQSAALNTFGLSAENAGHVADVLANVANASSGEITDFAQGMAQAGLVAKAMGVDVDSTATVLGIFANQGLSGSDAGTSFKTMLVSLQSPSKEAAAALDELGVKAYDANGNFVGMRVVTEQLSAAQKTMTTEQFNAAASTAFGTDAVRAAVAMAGQGTAGYDAMATAVSHAGGAQEVAAAQTKGVTGALNNVKNGLENAALTIYQEYSPALESMLNSAAAALPGVADFFMDVLGVGADFLGFINDLPGPVKVAAATMLAISVIKSPVSDAFESVGTKISSFKAKVEAAAAVAPSLVQAVSPLGGVLKASSDGAQVLAAGLQAAAEKAGTSKSAADGVKDSATPLAAVLSAAGEGAVVLGDALAGTAGEGSAAAEAAGEVTAASDPLSGALESAGLSADALTEGLGASSEKAKEVKGSAEAGAGGLRKLGAAGRIAGAGLLTAFGGPVGLAITVITTALSFYSGGADDAGAATDEWNGKLADLKGTLDQTTGAVTELARKKIADQIGTETIDRWRELGVNVDVVRDAIEQVPGAASKATADLAHLAGQAAVGQEGFSKWGQSVLDAGVSVDELGAAIVSGDFDSVNAKLAGTGRELRGIADGGVYLQGTVNGFDISSTIVKGEGAVKDLAGAFFTLNEQGQLVVTSQQEIATANGFVAGSADGSAAAFRRAESATSGYVSSMGAVDSGLQAVLAASINAKPRQEEINKAWADGKITSEELSTQVDILMQRYDVMAGRNGDAEAAQRAFNSASRDYSKTLIDAEMQGQELQQAEADLAAKQAERDDIQKHLNQSTEEGGTTQAQLDQANRDVNTSTADLAKTQIDQGQKADDAAAKAAELTRQMLTNATSAANGAVEAGNLAGAHDAAAASVQRDKDAFIALQPEVDRT